jgi:hypothetical protein
VPAGAPVLEQLIAVLAPRFAYWNADPALARHAVRETFAAIYPAGGAPPDPATAPPEHALRMRLAELIAVNQRAGRLAPGDDPELIARMVLDIYLSENRGWLAEPQPELARGVARLRATLALALRALILD